VLSDSHSPNAGWALLAVCLSAAACAEVAADIYKWVDADGVTHYAESPPETAGRPVQTIDLGALEVGAVSFTDHESVRAAAAELEASRLERERIRRERRQQLESAERGDTADDEERRYYPSFTFYPPGHARRIYIHKPRHLHRGPDRPRRFHRPRLRDGRLAHGRDAATEARAHVAPDQ
jgi:hypothetical protein